MTTDNLTFNEEVKQGEDDPSGKTEKEEVEKGNEEVKEKKKEEEEEDTNQNKEEQPAEENQGDMTTDETQQQEQPPPPEQQNEEPQVKPDEPVADDDGIEEIADKPPKEDDAEPKQEEEAPPVQEEEAQNHEEQKLEEIPYEPATKQDLPPVTGSLGSVRRSAQSPIQQQERYKITLIDQLHKSFTCPQCNDVLRYPVQFEECGHRVCSSCFHEFLRVEPRCPVDSVSINKDKCFLDKELNKKIMALEVKCNNHEYQCSWSGIHSQVQEHNGECEYQDILCVNDCGAKFQRRFLQKHLDKDCPQKIISCAFCDDRFIREDKKGHLEDCPKVPLPCPNKCDKKLVIPRDELDKHIEIHCPRTRIVCHFDPIGCGTRCSREKLTKHYKAGIIEHVRLVYDLLMKQGQRLDQHHELLQDHGALLESHQQQITDMERIARNQLIWRIDEFGRKMKEAKAGNTTTLFSPPFNTSKHGYRLCASLCLNGDGKGKGTHISAFVSILKGAYDNLLKWPFSYRVTFYLLDQNSDPTLRKHIRFSIKPNPCEDNEPFLGKPKMEKNASFGGAKFAKQEEVESRTYVKDDTIFLKIAVDCDGSVEP